MTDKKNDEAIPQDAKAQAGAVRFEAPCACGARAGIEHERTDRCAEIEVITPKPGPDLDAYMKAREDAQGAPQALATAAVNLWNVKKQQLAAKGWKEKMAARDHISIWRKTLEIAADKYAEAWDRLRACQDKLADAALTDPDRPERGPAPSVSPADAAAGRWPESKPKGEPDASIH